MKVCQLVLVFLTGISTVLGAITTRLYTTTNAAGLQIIATSVYDDEAINPAVPKTTVTNYIATTDALGKPTTIIQLSEIGGTFVTTLKPTATALATTPTATSATTSTTTNLKTTPSSQGSVVVNTVTINQPTMNANGKLSTMTILSINSGTKIVLTTLGPSVPTPGSSTATDNSAASTGSSSTTTKKTKTTSTTKGKDQTTATDSYEIGTPGSRPNPSTGFTKPPASPVTSLSIEKYATITEESTTYTTERGATSMWVTITTNGNTIGVQTTYVQRFTTQYSNVPSPSSGSIGLGTLTGTIGIIKEPLELTISNDAGTLKLPLTIGSLIIAAIFTLTSILV